MAIYPKVLPDNSDYPDRADDVDWIYAARYNELKDELIAICAELGVSPSGASETVVARLALLALKSNVLALDNTTPFTPDTDYEPATKKYVDESAGGGGDVTSASNITEHSVVRGADGAKGVELSTVFISDNGELINASQPCFSAKPAEGQSPIPINTATTIVWGTEIKDQGGNFASNAFTAPITGNYQFNALIYLSGLDSAVASLYATLVTSNRTYYFEIDVSKFSDDVSRWYLPLSIIADMDINDTCIVQIYQTNGTEQMGILDSSYFSGALLN